MKWLPRCSESGAIDTYIMVKISNAGEKWSNCSPGRLIIERTMAALHKDGVRKFDFSIGNYPYKRRFGVTCSAARRCRRSPLSWRGLPVVCARPRGAIGAAASRIDASRLKAIVGATERLRKAN
ncbi:MAG: GNAT family N-acetyltransferase [Nibricoccus sp.]